VEASSIAYAADSVSGGGRHWRWRWHGSTDAAGNLLCSLLYQLHCSEWASDAVYVLL
jgi:hypothetical protein